MAELTNKGGKREGQTAVLLELETLAVNGRKITFDVVANILADNGVKITPSVFSRKCLNTPARCFVHDLLKGGTKKDVSEDSVINEIKQSVKLSLADGKVSLNSQFKMLLEMARSKGVKTGLLSCGDAETAGKLLEKFGLMSEEIKVHPLSCETKNYPSPDAWLQLAKMLKVSPAACVAVATSSVSCKAALSAGMRCVVLPDSFTGFQDFGGSDYVIDSLDKQSAADILGLLETT